MRSKANSFDVLRCVRVLGLAAGVFGAAVGLGQTVVNDDFARADGALDGDGWTVHSGEWRLDGGALHAGPAAAEQHAYVGAPTQRFAPGDATVSVDMTFLIEDQQPVGRHAGLLLCMEEPDARTSTSGYLVWWIDREADRGLNLARRDNGTLTKLVDGSFLLDEEPPENVTVEFRDELITVLADGVELFSFEDATYRGGYFGLWTWNGAGQEVLFDNYELSVDAAACFTLEPARPAPDAAVAFDASCSGGFAGEIASYTWDFGDGSAPAMGAMVEHAFEFADVYIVALTVEDDQGGSAAYERAVIVEETCLPFEDTFEEGPSLPNEIENWTVLSGLWEVNDGLELVHDPGGESYVWAGDPPCRVAGDVTLSFDIDFRAVPADGVGRHASVFLYHGDPMRTRWETTGYSVWWIDRETDYGLGLHKWEGGGLQELQVSSKALGRDALPDPPPSWWITVEGPRIRVYGGERGVGYRLLLDVEEDSLAREGYVGFWTYSNGQEVHVDNFAVEAGAIAPPAPECPFACMTLAEEAPALDLPLHFDAGCSEAPDVLDAVYTWDFGDGTTAEGLSVEHAYSEAGSYTVELTLEAVGCEVATASRAINVHGEASLPYFADFEQDPGDDVEGWTELSGNWEITEDGALLATTQGTEGHIWVGDPPLVFSGDLTLEFDIEFLNHVGDQGGAVGKHAAVFFYAKDPISRWESESYDVWWIDRTEDFGLGLHRWPLTFLSPGTGIELPEFDLIEPPQNWRVEVKGDSIQVFGDDELLVDAVDSTRREGHIGFWVYSNEQAVRFDNLCIVEGPFEGPADCSAPATPLFRRGDVDGNGILEITDPINNLAFQFLGTFQPTCLDALDWDDNGQIELTDPIGSLSRQFLGSAPAPAPGSETCGEDPTPDALDCEVDACVE